MTTNETTKVTLEQLLAKALSQRETPLGERVKREVLEPLMQLHEEKMAKVRLLFDQGKLDESTPILREYFDCLTELGAFVLLLLLNAGGTTKAPVDMQVMMAKVSGAAMTAVAVKTLREDGKEGVG